MVFCYEFIANTGPQYQQYWPWWIGYQYVRLYHGHSSVEWTIPTWRLLATSPEWTTTAVCCRFHYFMVMFSLRIMVWHWLHLPLWYVSSDSWIWHPTQLQILFAWLTPVCQISTVLTEHQGNKGSYKVRLQNVISWLRNHLTISKSAK